MRKRQTMRRTPYNDNQCKRCRKWHSWLFVAHKNPNLCGWCQFDIEKGYNPSELQLKETTIWPN